MAKYELDYDKIKTVEDIVVIFKALRITWESPTEETLKIYGHLLEEVKPQPMTVVEN